MSKESKHYKQCRYERLDGSAWDESWIPTTLAQVGRLIHFGDAAQMFRVVSVGTRVRTAEAVHNDGAANRSFGASIDKEL